MPIKGLSEQLRMPRLGKIHLGVKKKNAKGVEYPSATDYFVCPPEIIKIYGEKPTSLPIMIPVEDEEYWASQYYRAYSQTRGLICKGDGETCQRMTDTKSGDIAGKDTTQVVWTEMSCYGRECQMYKDKKCSEMMCLQFMLPDVPGVGVWQIDTGSINSIRNINSSAALIRSICGRVKMLPLLLTLDKQEVTNPDDGKKKAVHVLNIRQRETLHSLIADSQKPVFELLAPVVDEAEIARDIAELWPQEEPEPKTDAPQAKSKPVEKESNVNLPEEVEGIDLTKVGITLKKINWSESTAKFWIISQFKLYKEATHKEKLEKSLGEVLADCTLEQKEQFVEHIKSMAEAS